MNSIAYIRTHLSSLISEHFKVDEKELNNISVKITNEENHGDLTCNAAMILASKLSKSPIKVAKQIVSLISSPLIDDEYENKLALHIQSADIAGPGFINIKLTEETWHTAAHELAVHPTMCFKLFDDEARQKYLIEFVSANPTGPLSLAHGRNAIIGDVLSNVAEFLGHNVAREYYINDAGVQITNLGQSLKAKCYELLGKDISGIEVQYDTPYMEELAKRCVQEFGESLTSQKDSFFEDFAKKEFLENIKNDLQEYGVAFKTWFSEKSLFTEGKVENSLEELNKNGFIFEKDGASWFKSTEFGDDKDRVIKKKDGNLTYVASDIAYHEDKFKRGFDRVINIFGQDHHSYALRLKATMQALGYNTDNFHILLYQLVRMKKGEALVRMSKRSGNFLSLKDVVETIGRDCARFFYLNKKYDAHLELDLDTALKQDNDNPVYYIHYAYVRTNSILNKAKQEATLQDYVQKLLDRTLNEVDTHDLEHDFNEDEINLLKKVCSLRSVLIAISEKYQTHHLALFTHELAQCLHSYYNSHKVMDPEDLTMTRSRLLIIAVVRNTLGLCLDLLGLSKPEKM